MATVLIVEDEAPLRRTLASFLRREGYEVLSASNACQAFERGVPACPDVLVADWMLKDHIHGLHVSEALKAVNPRLHTILITGFASRDLLAESNRCGVLQLLEKPFDLEALETAVEGALRVDRAPHAAVPFAMVELDGEGVIGFANERARDLFALTAGGADAASLAEVLAADVSRALERAEADWVQVPARGAGHDWLLRSRRASDGTGWLVAICPEQERARTGDARLRLLLEKPARSEALLPNSGPVIVIERDGAVRRLLVSQVERMGALCYPAADLEAALKLLAAEPRARIVLLDVAIAGDRLRSWATALRTARPECAVVVTGGTDREAELRAQGATGVLRKPWRITELLAVLDPRA